MSQSEQIQQFNSLLFNEETKVLESITQNLAYDSNDEECQKNSFVLFEYFKRYFRSCRSADLEAVAVSGLDKPDRIDRNVSRLNCGGRVVSMINHHHSARVGLDYRAMSRAARVGSSAEDGIVLALLEAFKRIR